LTLPSYLQKKYWSDGLSTQEIADAEGIPRSTIEHYMEEAGIPRRDLREARTLRNHKENTLKLGGKTAILAIGSGAFAKLPIDDCPQCSEAHGGGMSRRNHTSTLLSNGGEQLLINAPKGIFAQLNQYNANPKFVVVEHHQEDAIGGLHELRSLGPMVAASEETWSYLRQHYKELSGQEGRFEDIYSFPRLILRPGTEVVLGKGRQFNLTPILIKRSKNADAQALGFKIQMDGQNIWHSSSVTKIPDADKLLKDVQIYIGDGSSLTATDDDAHASIAEQLSWLKNSDVKRIYFTQIGHVKKNHKELASWLSEQDVKSQPFYDGAEINLTASSPSAVLPKRLAEKVANGEVDVILRAKPYQEYSKQVIYLVGGTELIAIMVEGLPEGPITAKEAKAMEHGMNEAEWKRMVGDSEKVWVYRPKIIKRYEPPREVEMNPKSTDLYLPETRMR
jgi:phosphoribosyl 1,2-cyclic phosphodiesterase